MNKEIDTKLKAHLSTKSKHRLADISHHFLSDSNERTPIWQKSSVIPFLLNSRSDDYIVYQLERSFSNQHRSSMVLNIEGGLNVSQSLKHHVPEQFSNHLIAGEHAEPVLPDFCLVPVTSPSTILALQCERLVITVHASLPGVRAAYNQLSFLASLKTNFNVCIVMFGSDTISEATRFFGFLRNNVRSLLELKLESGGYVLRTKEAESGLPSGMDEVTRFISEDFLGPQKSSLSKRLNKPFGPAAYLT